MAAALVMAGGKAPAPAEPAPAPAPRRCNFAQCLSDTPAEGLRECGCGNGPHHHFCSIELGKCEDAASRCAICLDQPAFAAAAVTAPEALQGEDSEGGDGEGIVDEEWLPLEGGPWVAKLMRPSRQPVAHALYRNFYVALPIDPVATPLKPGGKISTRQPESLDAL